MERKLYDAAVQGDKLLLLNLLEEDALLLDRFVTGRYPETPLHVASMLGHLEFVDEVVARKPELAKELDSRNSSPLHLASAKGYLRVVKSLLQVNPDMCLVCDIDGRTPIHISAMKGQLGVLRELVQTRPWAARQPMDQGETILHACVRCNQLEALKLLVERVSDHEFVNCKNGDGNTVMHLAIAAKQIEKMERKLYDAAVQGDKISLLNLLEEDALLLDRFITGRFPETPLHVASMLGHQEFVDEVLSRKPELAKELDSRNSSPLHLASAKGYLGIAKSLLQVNPDMCLVCDMDGRNPIHLAAMKGQLGVLRQLVQARPWAARLPMDQGETILHACVRCNQLEALKLLVERVSDHEFVNRQNYDGNTIMHLAVAAKQTETVNFLISSTTIDVNSENEDGLTALDLISENQWDMKEKEIVESLEKMEATRSKDKPLSNPQLKAMRTKILSSTWDQSNVISKPKKRKNGKKSSVNNKNSDWLERKRNILMLVASLLAAMAFQAGVNPPSGVWQDNGPSGFSSTESNGKNHTAGLSVLADNHPRGYTFFLIYNTTAFLASLSIILLLISGLPLRRRFFMWILMVIMWLAVTAMALAYLTSIAALTPDHSNSSLVTIIAICTMVWIGLMLVLLLVHTIRIIIRLIKYLRKLVIRLMKPVSTRPT